MKKVEMWFSQYSRGWTSRSEADLQHDFRLTATPTYSIMSLESEGENPAIFSCIGRCGRLAWGKNPSHIKSFNRNSIFNMAPTCSYTKKYTTGRVIFLDVVTLKCSFIFAVWSYMFVYNVVSLCVVLKNICFAEQWPHTM